MERDFIKRSIKASIIVAVIFTPLLLLYFGSTFMYGFIAGAAWNITNVFLLLQLITNLITPAESNKKFGAVAGLMKFPILYGMGYAIITYTKISIYGILAGFSLILFIFALKSLGIYYTNVHCQDNKSYGRGA